MPKDKESRSATVLISIHPKHVDKILSGEKSVEIRRMWAKDPVTSIIIYATKPASMIVARAKVKFKAHELKGKIWRMTGHKKACISEAEFYKYLEGKEKAFAIFLHDVVVLKKIIDPGHECFSKGAPQSFRYLTLSESECLYRGGMLNGFLKGGK